jgi:dTDP-glucose 4,6-dehydratase/UDP-glucose 4-epimerase
MNIRGKKFLVTGGTGFIGSALVRALVRGGAEVRSLDNDSRGAHRRLGAEAEAVDLRVGDIRDPGTVADAVEGVDCVCHLAYVNGTEFFYTKPALVLEVAVKGMINVLDACTLHGVRDLVLASSSEVYQTPTQVPTNEHVSLVVPDVLNPRYSYGGGKIICELLAVNYGRTHFDRVAIFRPHNVYGPDMGSEHVIPQLIRRLDEAAKATPSGIVGLPIQGTGDETRAFVYIDDLVDGALRVIESGEHLGIYHIGNDTETRVADLAFEIAAVYGREIRLQPGPLQPGGTPRRCPDISKMRGLSYTPRVPLRQGLVPTVSWYTGAAKT